MRGHGGRATLALATALTPGCFHMVSEGVDPSTPPPLDGRTRGEWSAPSLAATMVVELEEDVDILTVDEEALNMLAALRAQFAAASAARD